MLFTDICGSTAMTERLGDDGGIALLHEHDAIVRERLATHDGREVKHTGDGIMASFRLGRIGSRVRPSRCSSACADRNDV